MTTMTPAQGRFLTSLLDSLTEVAPRAGQEARTRLRDTFHAGNLTKAEASRSIDVLKAAINLAKAPAPKVAAKAGISAEEQEMLARRRQAAASLNLTPGKRPAKSRARSLPTTNGIIASLRTWTPERAAADLTEEVPF